MSEEAGPGAEAPRARPLSAGLWTLFSWLKREDRSSSDSLSSVGSDRTVASFAFLAPPVRRVTTSPHPVFSFPTDTYKKLVHERNLRRQYDRDLTLRSKYGLFRGEGGYDAFSLPIRRGTGSSVDRQERERRATSECGQRRAAYIPGKRRAPQPPVRAATLGRRRTRKRPAPQPPIKLANDSKDNTTKFEKMNNTVDPSNSKTEHGNFRPLSNVLSERKSETPSVPDKSPKLRKEKSFLKHIFENKKRNSTIDPTPGKILPSISELDKQAAEIIKTCKLRAIEQNNNIDNSDISKGDMWFCTRCLRKYDSTVVTCKHCLPNQTKLYDGLNISTGKDITLNGMNIYTQTENKSNSNVPSTSRLSAITSDEKQKLKEMLKEMKDSLPKPHKSENKESVKQESMSCAESNNRTNETPTLRIGSKLENDENIFLGPSSSSKHNTNYKLTKAEGTKKEPIITKNTELTQATETALITQHPVLIASDIKHEEKLEKKSSTGRMSQVTSTDTKTTTKTNDFNNERINVEKSRINTPLRISSLLNPIYIPNSRNDLSPDHNQKSTLFSQIGTKVPVVRNESEQLSGNSSEKIRVLANIKSNKETTSGPDLAEKVTLSNEHKNKKGTESADSILITATQENIFPSERIATQAKLDTFNQLSNQNKSIHSSKVSSSTDQHSKRRDLINILEQSIAKGDEKAAAEAAAKLAQLRLSCSVLSFSSQIVGQSSKTAPNVEPDNNNAVIATNPTKLKITRKTSAKVDAAVQSVASVTSNKQLKNKDDIKVYTIAQENKPSTTAQLKPIDESEGKLCLQPNENKDDLQKIKVAKPSTSKLVTNENGAKLASIEVWVEDREATRGPIRLRVPPSAVMGELRQRAAAALGLAVGLQRWIVGRTLCTDDSSSLMSLAGSDLNAPFYLCLVESELNNDTAVINEPSANKAEESRSGEMSNTSEVYTELIQLEKHALVPNAEPFECGVCIEDCPVAGGAILRDCVHTFCRACLSDMVRHCEEPVVSCPAMGCPGILQEREIRALVSPVEYERWLARGLAAAESGTRNSFHCRTRDCTGWALCEPGVRRFPCPVCKRTNCVLCQAIHEGETCEQHRAKPQQFHSPTDDAAVNDEGTRALLDTLISKGEALKCPECGAVITKKWGCDWVKCSACKTEICWVTRGPRWGPGGRGDTSAGCRCGVDGKRCHPSCGYCH